METCACEKCVSACRRDPGRLVPADVKKIAGFLKIGAAELCRRYLVRIPARGRDGHVQFLAPAKIKAKRFLAAPGSVVPDYYASEAGRCVFLSRAGAVPHPRGQALRVRRLHGLQAYVPGTAV